MSSIEARRANRVGSSRHAPALPLYTVADAKRALARIVPLAPGRSTRVGGVTVSLTPVGHLLGACAVTLAAGGATLVFSGDLGRGSDLLMPPPQRIARADVLLVESTYGDRLHPPEDVQTRLGAIVRATVRRGGSVLLPSSSATSSCAPSRKKPPRSRPFPRILHGFQPGALRRTWARR